MCPICKHSLKFHDNIGCVLWPCKCEEKNMTRNGLFKTCAWLLLVANTISLELHSFAGAFGAALALYFCGVSDGEKL